MNEKQVFKMREEIQGILEKITSEYDLKNTVLLSSKGIITSNRDMSLDIIIPAIYLSLFQTYDFILRESDNKELCKKSIDKSIEASIDQLRKFIFKEQNNE